MPKILQCPYFICYGGTMGGCLLGYFPINCETCGCPDKSYIEVSTSVGTSEWPNYLK